MIRFFLGEFFFFWRGCNLGLSSAWAPIISVQRVPAARQSRRARGRHGPVGAARCRRPRRGLVPVAPRGSGSAHFDLGQVCECCANRARIRGPTRCRCFRERSDGILSERTGSAFMASCVFPEIAMVSYACVRFNSAVVLCNLNGERAIASRFRAVSRICFLVKS